MKAVKTKKRNKKKTKKKRNYLIGIVIAIVTFTNVLLIRLIISSSSSSMTKEEPPTFPVENMNISDINKNNTNKTNNNNNNNNNVTYDTQQSSSSATSKTIMNGSDTTTTPTEGRHDTLETKTTTATTTTTTILSKTNITKYLSNIEKIKNNEIDNDNNKKKNMKKKKNNNKSAAAAPIRVNMKDCLNKNGPIPVLFLVHGRSGSTVTWQVLSNLSGYESKALELPGPFQDTIKNFFIEKQTKKDKKKYDLHGHWVFKHLCAKRQIIKDNIIAINNNITIENKHISSKNKINLKKKRRKILLRDVIYGFQWKPYIDSIYLPAAQGTFTMLRNLVKDSMTYTRNTNIKIIRSRRNPIDVTLSNIKHELSLKLNGPKRRLPPYCDSITNIKCIQRHKRLGSGLYIENVTEFYNTVQDLYLAENEIDNMIINHYQIPTIIVSYEELFYPTFNKTDTSTATTTNNNNMTTTTNNNNDNEVATEWNKIFKFVGSSKQFWKWKDIWNTMKIVATTPSRSHKDIISNYDEVYNVFKGTDIEFLLRP